MFDMKAVRKEVSDRLAILGRVDEHIIHELYSKAVYDELKRSRKAGEELGAAMKAQVKANHPEKGWIMLDEKAWSDLFRKWASYVNSF